MICFFQKNQIAHLVNSWPEKKCQSWRIINKDNCEDYLKDIHDDNSELLLSYPQCLGTANMRKVIEGNKDMY